MPNQTQELDVMTLEGRKRLILTFVESVDGFNEQVLKLTVNGNKLVVSGENIKITAFNKGTGNFSAEGVFNEIKYAYKKPPVIKRLFK